MKHSENGDCPGCRASDTGRPAGGVFCCASQANSRVSYVRLTITRLDSRRLPAEALPGIAVTTPVAGGPAA
jgi:hypothetical protein